MPFFGEYYTLRRFEKEKIVNGYASMGYKDTTVFLDVQTLSDDEMVEEGGSRDKWVLKTFGDFPIRCSKQEEGVKSDQLFYEGRWFECSSSRCSRNTILNHWTSTFVLIPANTEPEPISQEGFL